ncbi:MAG: aldehyde dehydrogenase [Puniceicoccaceae bacterium]|nr:MAG: aldehyde dehydrogenase [Puniceicoccaceae bacterium]
MVTIGINGFGRIGRALTRINLRHKKYRLAAINDIDQDIDNHAYLLKYDTSYGKLRDDKVEVEGDLIKVNGDAIKTFSEREIKDVPWGQLGIDVVIDASGVLQNVLQAKEALTGSVKKVIVTHAPNQGIDFSYMYGVNSEQYDKSRHDVISSSICDANALGPFYTLVDHEFGIELGEVTTLHPWLSYQNLLDGTLQSVSSPGHQWRDFALGRSSVGSLIPKETTLCGAMTKLVPDSIEKLHAFSFRTPTSIVSSIDGAFLLRKETTLEEVHDALKTYTETYPGVLKLDARSLVSIDYLGNECGAAVDLRWLHLNRGKMLKFVLWYDNEWGYASRVYDMINRLL